MQPTERGQIDLLISPSVRVRVPVPAHASPSARSRGAVGRGWQHGALINQATFLYVASLFLSCLSRSPPALCATAAPRNDRAAPILRGLLHIPSCNRQPLSVYSASR